MSGIAMPALAKLSRPKLAGVLPRERRFGRLDVCRQHAAVWISGPPGARKALQLLPADDTRDPAKVVNEHRLIRGEALCALSRQPEGSKWLESYLEAMASVWSDIDPDLARTRAVAGLCALAAGDRVRAIAHGDLARSAFERQPRIAAYWKEPSERLDQLLRR